MTLNLRLRPRTVAIVMGACIALLAAASVAVQAAKYLLHRGTLMGVGDVLNLGLEANLPTWYSTITLLFCSALLAVIGFARRAEGDRWAQHWLLLAVLFLGLSADETAQIHELANLPMSRLVPATGWLYFSWVVAGAAFVALVGLAYLRFILALPRRTRLLFIIAAVVFVAGALGAEMAGARWAFHHGRQNLTYELFRDVEEVLEMIGILIFASALADYLEAHVREVQLRLGR